MAPSLNLCRTVRALAETDRVRSVRRSQTSRATLGNPGAPCISACNA